MAVDDPNHPSLDTENPEPSGRKVAASMTFHSRIDCLLK
jgi:hypothetical protein